MNRVDDNTLEALARAYEREDASQRGEPDPWDDGVEDPIWRAERLACAKAAMQAIGRTRGAMGGEATEGWGADWRVETSWPEVRAGYVVCAFYNEPKTEADWCPPLHKAAAYIVTNEDFSDDDNVKIAEFIVRSARAALANITGEEPVAWQWRSKNDEGEWSRWTDLPEDSAISKASENRLDIQVRPLFARPPLPETGEKVL